MHSKKYRTMRRNSRKYQPKHLKVETFGSRFTTVKKINTIIMATALLSITLVLVMHCCLMTQAQETQIVNMKTTSVYISTTLRDPIEITDNILTPLIEVNDPIEPETTEITEYKIEQNLLPAPTENKVQELDKLESESTNIDSQIGNVTINIGDNTLIRHDLPSKYYPNLDFSSFQPYMCYTKITNTSAPAYHIVNSDLCYTDEFGIRRYKTNDSQFTVNGEDDYVIALGTFYKEKGLVGNRYLIVTSTGMYTAITGDEKSDAHTDSRHMFTMHDGNTKAGIIEWIVDQPNLNQTIKMAGTVTVGGPEVLRGEILYIYEIQ